MKLIRDNTNLKGRLSMMQMVASPLTSPERTASSTIETYGSLSPKSENLQGANSFSPRLDLQGVLTMTRYEMTCRWPHLHRLQQRLCRKHLNCAFGAWMHIVSLCHSFCFLPLVCVRKSLICVYPWTKAGHLVSVCGPDLSVSMNPRALTTGTALSSGRSAIPAFDPANLHVCAHGESQNYQMHVQQPCINLLLYFTYFSEEALIVLNELRYLNNRQRPLHFTALIAL